MARNYKWPRRSWGGRKPSRDVSKKFHHHTAPLRGGVSYPARFQRHHFGGASLLASHGIGCTVWSGIPS
uniref:Ribosomal protein L2 n=1 Tax=Pavo cristatus TaxID=9049 RepID=A0A8C9F4D0_PAVCR